MIRDSEASNPCPISSLRQLLKVCYRLALKVSLRSCLVNGLSVFQFRNHIWQIGSLSENIADYKHLQQGIVQPFRHFLLFSYVSQFQFSRMARFSWSFCTYPDRFLDLVFFEILVFGILDRAFEPKSCPGIHFQLIA